MTLMQVEKRVEILEKANTQARSLPKEY